jgi:hypothetical protein
MSVARRSELGTLSTQKMYIKGNGTMPSAPRKLSWIIDSVTVVNLPFLGFVRALFNVGLTSPQGVCTSLV